MRSKMANRLFRTELPFGERDKVEIVRVGRERSLGVGGVEKILEYGAECMRFRLREEDLEIFGAALDCTLYESGYIDIRGRIDEVRFRTHGGKL